MFKKKNIIRILIGLAVVLLIIFAVAKKKGWIGKPDVTKVSTELAIKRTIVETVSANGKIEPEVEVKLSPDVSGEIVELLVKEGDQVTAGQLLAKINPEIYISSYDRSVAALNTQQANLANSKARLAQVKSQLANAKSSFDRNDKLHNQKAISDAEFETSKSTFEVAQAEVDAADESVKAAEFNIKSAEASVKEAKENLSKTSIFAPVGGTISKLDVEKGERVAGASQFSAGTEILRIANLQTMEVKVSVNENDIVRVTQNDTALVEVDAYQNRKFRGIVTEISTSANTTGVSADQVTNFEVKIRILPESYKDLVPADKPNLSPFRPGMSATVDIQTESVVNALSIPIQAVTTRLDSTKIKQAQMAEKDKNGEPNNNNQNEDQKTDVKKANTDMQEYVFIYDKEKVKMVKVKTGIQDNTNIQILEGLKEKDEIVVAPYSAISKKLKDGDVVKKVEKKDLYSDK
ncbi:MAG: efflux RND transporter periplasmic adaptor subunit [Bacteroidetes bacterium]|nr:efflux RND transporter periplasmic adaptor subunit [Bacteroidota bacterium]